MRATQDKGIDLRFHHLFQVAANDLVGDGVLQPPFLDEGDEQGAWLAGDLEFGSSAWMARSYARL